MHDHNLDDLIIGEPAPGGGKSKNFLTLLALALIVVLLAVIGAKLLLGGDEKAPEVAQTEIDSVVKPQHHRKAPQTEENLPPELQPIRDDKLPETVPVPKAQAPQTRPAPQTRHTAPTPPVRHPHPTPKPPVHKAPAAPKHPAPARPAATVAKQPAKHPSALFHSRDKTPRQRRIEAEMKRYYIQVGSFKRPPTQKFLDKIKAQGYTPVIVNAGNMIKVRVGPYPSYTDAKAHLPEIKQRLGIAGFVVRSR
ncbi:SPOR domain-containing protein [Nitratifractor sp.]